MSLGGGLEKRTEALQHRDGQRRGLGGEVHGDAKKVSRCSNGDGVEVGDNDERSQFIF